MQMENTDYIIDREFPQLQHIEIWAKGRKE